VGTQESNRAAAESQVDQRLMPGCLLPLRFRAAGPDRLADAAHALATMITGIGPDRRDDPRRVTAQLRHINQHHLRRILTQLLAHQLGLALRNRDENRLTARPAGLDEGAQRRQVLAAAVVKQRQMTQPAPGGRSSSHLSSTRARAWPRPDRPHRNTAGEEETSSR